MLKVQRLYAPLSDLAFSILFGALTFCLLMGGWTTLSPRNFQWISGDNTSGYVAQLFYLSDHWRYPIASNPNFGLELSTSLIYTGPPLPIAIIQKILNIDPALQFIGVWLMTMIVLQIWFGIQIARHLKYRTFSSLLAGLLFITPFFLYRFQVHYWLTAHFLILWAFWITLRCLSSANLYTVEISILIILGYSINIYILVMSLIILSYPIVLMIIESQGLKIKLIRHILTLLSSLIASYTFFDFGSQKSSFFQNLRMNFTGEYTKYPSNLFSLFNPEVGYSRNCNQGHCVFGNDPIPHHFIQNFSIFNFDLGGVQGNFDAFLYLGFGILILLIFSIYSIFLFERPRSELGSSTSRRLLVLYVVIISAYAVTYKVSLGNYQLDLGDPKLLRWGLSMFRASGRFMWIIAYLLIIFSLFVLSKSVRKEHLGAFVFIVVLIQCLDIYPAMHDRFLELENLNSKSISFSSSFSSEFEELARGKDTLMMYPPGTQKGWPTLAYLSWKSNLKSGMFQSSRVNDALRIQLENRLRLQVCSNEIPYNWLIIIPANEFKVGFKCSMEKYRVSELGEFIAIEKN